MYSCHTEVEEYSCLIFISFCIYPTFAPRVSLVLSLLLYVRRGMRKRGGKMKFINAKDVDLSARVFNNSVEQRL